MMKWCSALSENKDIETAIMECVQKVKSELSGALPDLAFLFISPHYSDHYGRVSSLIFGSLRPKLLLGCSAGGIIGGGKEVEREPGLSMVCASMEGVHMTPFHIEQNSLPDLDASPKSWRNLIGAVPVESAAASDPQFIFLADPFSIDLENFVMGLDYGFPRSPKVGGLASGAQRPGDNALFLNQDLFREGVVGAALTGNIVLETIVAQGCRPIGDPMVVTSCQRNILMELDHKPPLRILEQLFETLSPRDQNLLRTSLFLGLVMDPSMPSFSRGDFLIRNIVGADPEKGILSIGAELREGQTVQFHLRDSETSAEDLNLMLTQYSSASPGRNNGAKGALLFSCLGRGIYLYGVPDHDSKMFHDKIGEIPLGGFFCNGEIGPVRGRTYIHGYTSCFGIFKEKNPS